MVKKIICLLIASRIIFFVASYLLSYNFEPSFGKHILAFANQWDSPHYLYIAENGYTKIGDESNFIVFMPAYPIIIKLINLFLQNIKIAGLFTSNLFFILGGIMFYKLLRIDYTEKFSVLVIILLSVFPTSFFYSSVYPESLFLLLFCSSLYFARKGRWLPSLLAATVLTLTRPFGFIIWISLIIEIEPLVLLRDFLKNKTFPPHSRKLIFSLTFSAVLSGAIYFLTNYYVYGDPFAFQKILSEHWLKSFAFPWEGIRQSWTVAIHGNGWNSYRIYVGLSEALASTMVWVLGLVSLIKKANVRISYSLFLIIGALLFTSTGFILSSPRYILSLPPFFIVLAKVLHFNVLTTAWIMASVALLIFLATNFSMGLWTF
jgi:hypothetical protein